MACKKGFRRAIRCYGKRIEMRNALGKSLAKIFSHKKEHHLFSGDIGYRIFDELVKNSPSQFHNFGISEQHMVTFAASFAVRMGSTSIVYTISPFITSKPTVNSSESKSAKSSYLSIFCSPKVTNIPGVSPFKSISGSSIPRSFILCEMSS